MAHFHPGYRQRVLEPSYQNWTTLYLEAAAHIQRVHLVMLAEQRLIPEPQARALASALDGLGRPWVPPADLPEGAEDLYFLYESELEKRVGEAAGWLSLARSRNDFDTTAFRLVWRDRLDHLLQVGLGLVQALRDRSEDPTLVILATHGQPANPSTLGHYLSSFLLEVLEDLDALVATFEVVDRSTLGACAITGTGFAIDRHRTAELLGLGRPAPHTYQAIATSHWLTHPAAALAGLAIDLTRWAADLGAKAAFESGQITFPDDLVQGSSLMPQKRNPVLLEHLRIQAGLAASGLEAGVNLFRNVAWQDVNEVADAPVSALLGALDTLESALGLASLTAQNLKVVESRVREGARASGITATELADRLVRDSGVGFRQAHQAVAQFLKSGQAATLGPVASQDGWVTQALSPEGFVAARKVPGGPAPEGMASVLDEADRRTAALVQFRSHLASRRTQAAEALEAAFAAWAGPR